MRITELTLSDLLKQSELAPIWVRNNVHRSHDIGKEGDLVLNIQNPNGNGSTVIRIDRTWLPIDLTTQMSRRGLLESSEFRAALTSRYFIAIDESSAQKLLRSSDAEDEKRRLSAQQEYIRTATGVMGVTNDDYGDQPSDTSRHQEIPDGKEEAEKDMFTSWLESLGHKEDTLVLSELRTRRLNRKQAQRILKALDSKKHPRSIAILKRTLSK